LPLHGVTLNNISAGTYPEDGALYIPFRIIYSISRLFPFLCFRTAEGAGVPCMSFQKVMEKEEIFSFQANVF
jgi:hypothetical protein